MTDRNAFTPMQEKWLAALESGEFNQITMNLVEFDDDGKRCEGMCCLGVATQTVNPQHSALKNNGWDRWEWADEHGLEIDEVEQYGDDECTAPPDVIDALCLVRSDGRLRLGASYEGQDSLVGLNDKARLTFSEIAAFIRKKPWLVFTNFDAPVMEASQ